MVFQTEGSNWSLSRFIVSSLHGLDGFGCSFPTKLYYSWPSSSALFLLLTQKAWLQSTVLHRCSPLLLMFEAI